MERVETSIPIYDFAKSVQVQSVFSLHESKALKAEGWSDNLQLDNITMIEDISICLTVYLVIIAIVAHRDGRQVRRDNRLGEDSKFCFQPK
jgi:hypothetical protein